MDDTDEVKDDSGVERISKNKLGLKNEGGGEASKDKKIPFLKRKYD